MVSNLSRLLAIQETLPTWNSQITSPSWTGDSQLTSFRLFCQYFLLLHFSLHVTCRNKHSHCFTSTRTNKHKYGPSDFSFPHRPFKQFKTYTWRLYPKSSPTTLYHEIKSSPPPENQNRASSSSDSVFQIAVALAEVTQLQRLPQAKPDIFTGDRH